MKSKDKIGFRRIIFGFVFLASPCVHIIDVLPDFFGMLLILSGMKKLADTETHCGIAQGLMKKAMWVSLGKLACMILSVFTSLSDSYMLLIYSLSGGILDCVFLIPAMRELFYGMDYLRLWATGHSQEERVSEITTLSAVFVVVRGVLSCVPVTLPLFENYYGEIASGGRDISLSAIRILLSAVCAALILALGIIWLVSSVQYINVFSRDGEFCDIVYEKYSTEVLQNVRLMRKRKVRGYFSVLLPSLVLLLCVRIDYVYISFSFLLGVCLLICDRVARDLAHSGRGFRVMCILQTAAGFAGFILMYKYCEDFGGYLFPYEEDGFLSSFLPCVAAEALSLALLCVILNMKSRTEKNMCDAVAGLFPGREEIDAEIKRGINKKIVTENIFSVIYCAVSLLCVCSIPFAGKSDLIALSWLVRSGFAVALIIQTSNVSSRLREETEK